MNSYCKWPTGTVPCRRKGDGLLAPRKHHRESVICADSVDETEGMIFLPTHSGDEDEVEEGQLELDANGPRLLEYMMPFIGTSATLSTATPINNNM